MSNKKILNLIENEKKLKNIFSKNKFDVVINLAAQAGIRYSLENLKKYITSNINNFNLIDLAKKYNVNKNLFYASSSSVYGNSNKKFL